MKINLHLGLWLVSLVSVSSVGLAAELRWRATCDAVELYLTEKRADGIRGYIYVGVHKEGQLSSEVEQKVWVSTNLHPMFGKKVEVAGLKVSVTKTTLLETTTKIDEGDLGKYEIVTNVYGVKFHLEADEAIGFTRHLDIAGPSKKEDKFAICTEMGSRPAQ